METTEKIVESYCRYVKGSFLTLSKKVANLPMAMYDKKMYYLCFASTQCDRIIHTDFS